MNGVRRAKRELRAEILSRRETIDDATREALSARILEEITTLDAFEKATSVLAYAGFGSELSTDGFLRTVLGRRKTLVLPRVEGGGLSLYAVVNLERDLVPGTWGIREPGPERCERVDAGTVDFALVPGVAFDAFGGRLGYGGGFYDRLLPRLVRRPLIVCGAFEVQMVERVPTDDSDVRVDMVITERRRYEGGVRP